MIENLYLHIGQYKCGSTSIQYNLAFHRNRLKRMGILYPEETSNFDNHIFFSNYYCKNEVEWLDNIEGKGKVDQAKVREEARKSILAQLSEKEYRTAIISSEHFCSNLDKNNISQLYEDICDRAKNIKVIIYLRHQLSHIDSAYKQRVFSHLEKCTFEEFLKKMLDQTFAEINYKKILSDFSEVFGKENIIVRNFDISFLLKGDVVADFNKLIGVHMAYMENRRNVSLSAFHTEIYRLVQESGAVDVMSKGKIAKNLMKKNQLNVDVPKYFYNQEQKTLVDNFFLEENKFISKEFQIPMLVSKNIEVENQFYKPNTEQISKFLKDMLSR